MNQHNNNVSLLDTPVPLAEDTLIPLQQVCQIFFRVQLALVCKLHPCMFFKLFSPALALVHLNRLIRYSLILFSGLLPGSLSSTFDPGFDLFTEKRTPSGAAKLGAIWRRERTLRDLPVCTSLQDTHHDDTSLECPTSPHDLYEMVYEKCGKSLCI